MGHEEEEHERPSTGNRYACACCDPAMTAALGLMHALGHACVWLRLGHVRTGYYRVEMAGVLVWAQVIKVMESAASGQPHSFGSSFHWWWSLGRFRRLAFASCVQSNSGWPFRNLQSDGPLALTESGSTGMFCFSPICPEIFF